MNKEKIKEINELISKLENKISSISHQREAFLISFIDENSLDRVEKYSEADRLFSLGLDFVTSYRERLIKKRHHLNDQIN